MLVRTLSAPLLALVAVGCQAAADGAATPNAPASTGTSSRQKLGLMTTLPIFWGEASDVSEVVQGKTSAGWVREALEADFQIAPLDTLDDHRLGGLDRLVLAQPRALTAAENLALDDWVRRGGRLLLFADPMLTGPSRYPIGDRRRPQDVILLSPILAHWALELTYDEEQEEGERRVEVKGVAVPVNLAGALRQRPGSKCAIGAGGIVAECRLGRGKVTILADAAVLEEPEEGSSEDRRAALAKMLATAFA